MGEKWKQRTKMRRSKNSFLPLFFFLRYQTQCHSGASMEWGDSTVFRRHAFLSTLMKYWYGRAHARSLSAWCWIFPHASRLPTGRQRAVSHWRKRAAARATASDMNMRTLIEHHGQRGCWSFIKVRLLCYVERNEKTWESCRTLAEQSLRFQATNISAADHTLSSSREPPITSS